MLILNPRATHTQANSELHYLTWFVPGVGEFFHFTWGLERKQGPCIWGIITFFFYSKADAPYFPGVGGGGGQLTGALHEPYGKLAPEATSLFEVGLPQRQIKTPFKPRFACSSAVRGQLYSHKCEILGFCRTRPV